MNIVYYTNTGNTERFVKNHLIPELKLHPVAFEGTRFPYRSFDTTWYQLEARGPHRPGDGRLTLTTRDPTVIVFPIYARADHEDGELRDTVPLCVQEFIKDNRESIIAAVAVGNRTFGKAFGYVRQDELDEIPLAGVAELSGTRAEAATIVEAIRNIAKEN